MHLTHRSKFAATIDGVGRIIAGLAATGYVASTDDNAFGSSQYLLENAAGRWEIGYQPTGDGTPPRVPVESSAGSFANGTIDLTCSIIATREAFVNCSYPDIETSVAAPVALGGDSMCIGRGATAAFSRDTVVGIGAYTTVGPTDVTLLGFKAYCEQHRGTAVGSEARAQHPGESAIGSAKTSHTSTIPVTTDVIVGAGTYTLKAIETVNSSAVPTLLSELTVVGPYNAYYADFWVRLMGTIIVRSAVLDDLKVFNIDCMTRPSGVIYSNITALFTGANVPAITLALNINNRLALTVPALTGIAVSGVLRADKLIFPSV